MTPLSQTPYTGTLAELLERLGDISPDRVLLIPPPGKATEKDLLRVTARTGRLFELVEATLVEKSMGFTEGALGARLIGLLSRFLEEKDLGTLAGADAMLRLSQGLVRLPDVSFIRWEKFPGGKLPSEAIPSLSPDLAVEVLSRRNTRAEMQRKRREYFLAGAHLVWVVDPEKRTVWVFTADDPERGAALTEADTLGGGDVLPGLALPVRRIFERLAPPAPAPDPAAAAPKPPRSRKKKN